MKLFSRVSEDVVEWLEMFILVAEVVSLLVISWVINN